MRAKRFSSAHWSIDENRRERLTVLRRSNTRFTSMDEIVSANRAVVEQLRAEHRRWGVVVDMRLAPRRNDPAFEEAMRGLREAVEARPARPCYCAARSGSCK